MPAAAGLSQGIERALRGVGGALQCLVHLALGHRRDQHVDCGDGRVSGVGG